MRGLWIVAALLALVPCGGAQESARGWRRARGSLAGPLDELVLREPGGSSTTVSTGLGPGARVTIDVPLSATPVELARRATIETRPPGGRCELEVIAETDWDARWLALPAGLRARTRPAVESDVRVPTIVEASVLGATLLAVLALRRRAIAALLAGLAGAALVTVLPPPEPGAPPAAISLEGDAASGRWLLVEARVDELELSPPGPLRLEVEPAGAALAFRVELRASEPDRWLVRAAGSRLARVDDLPTPGERFSPESNGLLDLSACWVRSSDGSWTEHGPWSRGEPLPPAIGQAAPPGWLASGLPPGLRVMVGRAVPGADFTPWDPAGRAVSRSCWVRYVGL